MNSQSPHDPYAALPKELTGRRQWVCWRRMPDGRGEGRFGKFPIDPVLGQAARSNDPTTWRSFEEALSHVAAYDGLGIMFADGLFGVDLDGCGQAVEAYLAGARGGLVADFVEGLDSYTERSPSGNGLHILCLGRLPAGGRRRGQVEMYDSGRFFTVTGDVLPGRTQVREATEAAARLHAAYIAGLPATVAPQRSADLELKPQQRAPSQAAAGLPGADIQQGRLTDEQLFRRIAGSRDGAAFQRLYRGDWQADYASQSEADFALCQKLAFWTGKDLARMDSLFRGSGLMRAKWDGRRGAHTYGQLTLARAADACRQTYRTPRAEAAAYAPQQPEPPARYSLDDTGNADRLVDLAGERLRYCFAHRAFYVYDGRRWQEDPRGQVYRDVDEMVDRLPEELALCQTLQEEKALLAHLRYSRSNRGKSQLVREIRHRLPVLPQQLDRHRDLLNTPAGVIDLMDGRLRPHDPALYLTRLTRAASQGDCPRFRAFLRQATDGDEQLQAYLQKAVGYSLTGDTSEQCIFVCYGAGRNGKSTLLEAVGRALGDYAANCQPETLMVRPAGGVNSDLARLAGARFVTSAEPAAGMQLNESLVKQLTGGDRVTARRLYGHEFEFTPSFKLWLSTNHLPRIQGGDEGIWRRIRLIPFSVTLPEDAVDPHLPDKLAAEAPGILAWAVEGCLRWRAEGLRPPDAVREATDGYREQCDALQPFFRACCRLEGRATARDLYDAYVAWCDGTGQPPVNQLRFGRYLGGRFIRKKVKGNAVYAGVSLAGGEEGEG